MPFIGKLPDVGAFRLIDSITTSATDTYALQVEGLSYFPSSARNLIVSLNGVTQAPESAYTVSGSNIVFDSALTASDVIDYILVIGESVDIGTPSDNTVGNAQLKSDLDFSGKTLTFSADQISGDAINGGTISSFASTGIDDNATSTAITIDSSQQVGVGTVDPKYSLDSTGAIYSGLTSYTGPNYGDNAGYLYLNGGNSGASIVSSVNSSQRYLLQAGLDNTSLITYNSTGFEINSNNTRIELGTAGAYGTGAGVIEFQTGSSLDTRMTITSSGNVGIGETNPTTAKLVVRNTDNDDYAIRVGNTAGASGSLAGITKIGLDTGTSSPTHPSAAIEVEQAAVSGYQADLVFSTRKSNSDIAPTESLRVTSEGRVSNGTGISKNYMYYPLPSYQMGASGITDEYLILCRYNDTGSAVTVTGVDGEILFSRGGLGSGNAHEKIEISVQDAWTVTPRVIRFNTSDVARFIRLDIITVDSQKYVAARAASSGGGNVNHIFFRGIVIGESTDSKLLDRVRESDSNVTVNTTGWMYPAGFEYRDDTTGGYLGIKVGGAEVGQFKSTGLHLENGKGIDFSAWNNASGVTSEVLDDYEEGTWTPVFTGTTSGTLNGTGTYTKVGRMVTAKVSLYTQISSGTLSGNLKVTGFPFAATGTFTTGLLHIRAASSTGTGAVPFGLLNSTTLYLHDTANLGNTNAYQSQSPSYGSGKILQNGVSTVIIDWGITYYTA